MKTTKETALSIIDEFPDVECQCTKCQSMCWRPCFGTPDDIQKLIEAGYEDRLCLDNHCGFEKNAEIDLLSPALKGHESSFAPLMSGSPEGCTFLKDGKCELHDKGLKPSQGRKAIHNHRDTKEEEEKYTGGKLGASISELWKDEKAQKMVEDFKAKRGLKSHKEEVMADPAKFMSDAIVMMMKSFGWDTK
jgi:hypothetical protein